MFPSSLSVRTEGGAVAWLMPLLATVCGLGPDADVTAGEGQNERECDPAFYVLRTGQVLAVTEAN
jgi:hypothetical protein